MGPGRSAAIPGLAAALVAAAVALATPDARSSERDGGVADASLRLLGEHAIPALIEARGDPSPAKRKWAEAMLESLGKRSPSDAVQTSDNQLLADVLLAYAHIHDFDALPVALSFINSDRAVVRAAARDATLAYGPRASGRLREAYALLTGEQAPAGLSAADLAEKLFSACDRARLRDVYALLDEGIARERAGDLARAVADYDAVLAREPMLDRRTEMAPAYAAYGESLHDADPPRALAYLREALRLDEAGPTSDSARSAIACIEGEDMLRHDLAYTAPFERALALDPKNARARGLLDALHARAAASRAQSQRCAMAAAVLFAALAGMAAVALRMRARG
jgi:tetratricopeptide (TPR) repeat protein